MLALPICQATTCVLARPHYPDNVGAVARALKTMGMTKLCLVKPSRLAVPEHERAHKMAVRAWDVLEATTIESDLKAALRPYDHVFATTGRRGVSGVVSPRQAAQRALELSDNGARLAILMGNEKTGLTSDELSLADTLVRIPMAAAQPSINLAQAVQVVAYEWFVAGLGARGAAALE